MPEPSNSLPPHVNENLESVVGLHQREQAKLRGWERALDRVGAFIGRPLFLIVLLTLVAAWIGFNALAPKIGWHAFDPPPFSLLDLLITFSALVTTTVVLMAQQRQARMESRKAHLDLQVSLLAEQKVSKIIRLLEELRRDSPGVRDRHDAEAAALQTPTDAGRVMSALEDMGASGKLDPALKE